MPHIARFAIFLDLPPQQVQAAEHNLTVRLVPTLLRQPGFIAGVWAAARQPANGFSFVCFTNPAMAQAAGHAINSAPLLPDQHPANLPDPSWVAMGPIIWEHHTPTVPRAVRLASLAYAQHADPTALTDLLTTTVVPNPHVCRAYLVDDQRAERYLLLTCWADMSAATLDAQLTPNDTLTFDTILHDVRST